MSRREEPCFECGFHEEKMYEIDVPGTENRRIVFCGESCYELFAERKRQSRRHWPSVVSLNAIVVSVIDYRTVGVVFLPDGKDVEEVRLLGAHLFHETDEEKMMRVEVLEKTLEIAENQEEGRHLAASVSVAGKSKDGTIVADVIVAFGCSIDIDDMEIKCVHEESFMISMETIALISVMTRTGLLKKEKAETKEREPIAGKAHWIQKALGRSQHIGYVKHMARRHHVGKPGESLSRSNLKKLMSVAKKTKSPHDDRRVQLALTLSKLKHRK